MLVRAFRVTDRFSNALLRISAWAAMFLVQRTTALKLALFGIILFVWHAVVRIVSVTTGTARTASTAARVATERTSRAAQQVSDRRRDVMVQRAAEAELKPTVREDPLLAQNRALSAFAVLAMLALLAFVVMETRSDNGEEDPVSGGGWVQSGGTVQPTPNRFPTAIPTETPIPDPLRVGGSLVYTQRENGQDDLWLIAVGESAPIRLTNDPADDRDPAWSPDGTKIAFASHRDGNWELYIMEIDTQQITRLTYTPGFEGAPSWSPDGAFVAYEGYNTDTNDLNIYFMSTNPARAGTSGSAGQITSTPGPDIEPAWSPDGRHLAYTTWRNGNQEIMVVNFDDPSNMLEQMAVNLTNTPDSNENYAAWNSDGSVIAYSAAVRSVEGVYIKPVTQPTAEPVLIGQGRMPTWSPNDASLVYMLDFGRQTQLLADTAGPFGGTADATQLSSRATDPDWTATPLPPNLIASGGLPPGTSALYDESPQLYEDNLYRLAPMNNVVAPQPFLADTVDDSFEGLRQRVIQTAGYDFLGTLEEVYWPQSRPTEPGEPRENWHYAGRAFAIDRNLVYAGSPSPIEVVREDMEVDTYWRMFVRVVSDVQDGRLGEPLRVLPWDLTARTSGDVEDYERGGKLMTTVPSGYYVDLTQLAEDFGWERVPSDTTWRYNFSAIQYWEFRKTDGLSWNDAMLQIYTADQLQGFTNTAPNISAPVPLPTASPTPGIRGTNTPIPPDTLQ